MSEIQGKSLREFLAENGAQKTTLSSKWVLMAEDAIVDDEISSSETARESIERMERRITDCDDRVDDIVRGISRAETLYSNVIELLRKNEIAAHEIAIKDNATLEALALYGRVLVATRDTFGAENMSEAVICKAIEAASYGMWRSIMGPKYEEKSGTRRVL